MTKSTTAPRLARIHKQAGSIAETLDPTGSSVLITSASPDERLLALARMRVAIDRGVPATNYLAAAHQLVLDEDNDCRWQALIVIGESIAHDPDSVWAVVDEFGSAGDADLRSGVATVLLEHLLELHFDRFYGRVVTKVLSGDKLFADTVSSCWVSSPGSIERKSLDHLLEAAKHGLKGVK